MVDLDGDPAARYAGADQVALVGGGARDVEDAVDAYGVFPVASLGHEDGLPFESGPARVVAVRDSVLGIV